MQGQTAYLISHFPFFSNYFLLLLCMLMSVGWGYAGREVTGVLGFCCHFLWPIQAVQTLLDSWLRSA